MKKYIRDIIGIGIVFMCTIVPAILAKSFYPEDIPANLDVVEYGMKCLGWLIFLSFTAWVIVRRE